MEQMSGTETVERPRDRFPMLAELIDYLDGVEERVDLEVLSRLLNAVAPRREDLGCVCRFGSEGYKRNTISRSERYELLALCWHSGHSTPIHDHRGSSCAFRVIEGVGTEIRFRKTESGLVCPTASVEMHPGYVCAAQDDDIHQVANMQAAGADLITMHIYSPPIRCMNTYEYRSGHADCC